MGMYDDDRRNRARAIVASGGVTAALEAGLLPRTAELTVAEALVIGLLKQDVCRFIGVFGHGSTELGDVLRVYSEVGATRVLGVRNETEAAHAATALRWTTGVKCAVFTSIGPGALHAMAGSLAASSDGIGVWHLYADETTEDEGPNLQQIPGSAQAGFLKLTSVMGPAYSLHTAQALPEALRRGRNAVDRPYRAQPFYLLLPINMQPKVTSFNLDALPTAEMPALGAAGSDADYDRAAKSLLAAERVVVRVGGGARGAGQEIAELLDLVDGFAVVSPMALGVLPASHPRNMGVGGSKGSISGNYAMENADLLCAIGSRGVCQADMSRTGYPKVTQVVNINAEFDDVMHYNRTIGLRGDAAATVSRLVARLKELGAVVKQPIGPWADECAAAQRRWGEFYAERMATSTLADEVWGREVLTQPAVIHTVHDWASAVGRATIFYDAGDVQANGFQIAADEEPGRTVTETGASYMGFASSALLATTLGPEPFFGIAMTGDGSFTMSPQVLIDGVQHSSWGVVVLLDNRRQGAISSLQRSQYGDDFATSDDVEVDYCAWAASVRGVQALHGGYSAAELRVALDKAHGYHGLSLIHVPVYFGPDPRGGMGSFGRWNVGPWVENTEALQHEIGM